MDEYIRKRLPDLFLGGIELADMAKSKVGWFISSTASDIEAGKKTTDVMSLVNKKGEEQIIFCSISVFQHEPSEDEPLVDNADTIYVSVETTIKNVTLTTDAPMDDDWWNVVVGQMNSCISAVLAQIVEIKDEDEYENAFRTLRWERTTAVVKEPEETIRDMSDGDEEALNDEFTDD